MVGSVAPDLDLIAFYLIDDGQVHHHTYLRHRPAFWLLMSFAARFGMYPVGLGIGFGALLHLVLELFQERLPGAGSFQVRPRHW